MKQIFALTSTMLAVEFTNQYSEQSLLETLCIVGQKTGVKFDRVKETYKLTGQWLNVLEAYDILLNFLLTDDMTNLKKDSGWGEPLESLDTEDSAVAVCDPTENHTTLPGLVDTDRENHSSKIQLNNTRQPQTDIGVCSVENQQEYEAQNDAKAGINELQPSASNITDMKELTAAEEMLERKSRRKAVPYRLFMDSDDNEDSNISHENVMKGKKHKFPPVKLNVKKKRGRKRKIRDEDEVYKCVQCEYVGKTMYQLNRHKKRLHNDGSKFHCDQCSKSYGVSSDLTRHKKTVHETPLFQCEICQRSYKSKRGYDDHVKSHKEDYLKPVFPCTMCDKSYSSKLGLAHHQKGDHLGMRFSFLCSICGQSFTNKVSYKGHLNTHAGIKPHICKVCGKCFAFQRGLWLHSRTHDETCRYSCDTCGKTFRQNNSLKVHKRIHAEIRNYICSLCGKAFTQKQALNRHGRVHSGEKPFECLLCCKRFYDTSIIRRHMIFMHKKEPNRWRDDMFTHVKSKKDTLLTTEDTMLNPTD